MLLTESNTRQEDLKKGKSMQEKVTTAILLCYSILLRKICIVPDS